MKKRRPHVGMDFNVLGMIDLQGVSAYSKEKTLLSTWSVYSDFINVIEDNDYLKCCKKNVSLHLLGDAVYFYFPNAANDSPEKTVQLMSYLLQGLFVARLDLTIGEKDIPLGCEGKKVIKVLEEQELLDGQGNVTEKFLRLNCCSELPDKIQDIIRCDDAKCKIFNLIHGKINMPWMTVRGSLAVGSVYGQKDFKIKTGSSFDLLLGSAVSNAFKWEGQQQWFLASADQQFTQAVMCSNFQGQFSDLKQKNYLIEYSVPVKDGYVKTLVVNFVGKDNFQQISDVSAKKLSFYKRYIGTSDEGLFCKMCATDNFIKHVVSNQLFIG
ncbi:MAG: hypothetical protein HGA87_02245 [Desulfobulbaceae bacterium]|nr:hypothetical protein [Desulfobulbaceae bacterium]